MNSRQAKSPALNNKQLSEQINLKESSILDSSANSARVKKLASSQNELNSKKLESQLKLSTNNGAADAIQDHTSSGLISRSSNSNISSAINKQNQKSSQSNYAGSNSKDDNSTVKSAASQQIFGKNSAKSQSSQGRSYNDIVKLNNEYRNQMDIMQKFSQNTQLTVSKLSEIGTSQRPQKTLQQNPQGSRLNTSQLDQRSQLNSIYKSSASMHRSYIPNEEQEIIDELNEKLEKIREENRQLEAQMEYVCDNENQSRLESSIQMLQKQVDEETENLNTLQKQLDDQQRGIFQFSTIHGMDIEVELKNQLAIAMEKSKMADDEYTNLQQYLQMASEAEKALLKYIPSYYHLLIKSDTMTSQFETTLSKMQTTFKRLRGRAGMVSGQRKKASESVETHRERREEIAGMIADAKQQIEVYRKRREELHEQAAKEREQLEQETVEVAFNYKQLLKMVDEALQVKNENSFGLSNP